MSSHILRPMPDEGASLPRTPAVSALGNASHTSDVISSRQTLLSGPSLVSTHHQRGLYYLARHLPSESGLMAVVPSVWGSLEIYDVFTTPLWTLDFNCLLIPMDAHHLETLAVLFLLWVPILLFNKLFVTTALRGAVLLFHFVFFSTSCGT